MNRQNYSIKEFLSFLLTLIQRDDGQKRNRLWRQRQQMRVFKARMMYFSACGHSIRNDDGSWNEHPHWFEIARERWAKAYRTTGTPCSCWICRGEKYNRREYKKESRRIIREELVE